MKRLTNILIAVVVVLVLAGGAYWYFVARNKDENGGGDMSRYSAVALTSNELFFGHIKSQDSTKVVLEDVYFFTFVPDTTNGSTDTNKKVSATDSTSNANMRPTLIDTNAKDSLAPTSTYTINRDLIKYTYPLKNGTQVVKTIEEYRNK